MDLTPHQIPEDSPMMGDLLRLMRDCFAYMEGRIDPPSSLGKTTLASLRTTAAEAEIWVIGMPPVACMILSPRTGTRSALPRRTGNWGCRVTWLNRQKEPPAALSYPRWSCKPGSNSSIITRHSKPLAFPSTPVQRTRVMIDRPVSPCANQWFNPQASTAWRVLFHR